MKRSALIITSLIWLMVACEEPPSTVPDYLLNEEKMVDVMVDMHLVETANNLKLLSPDTTGQQYDMTFKRIFATHKVSKVDFDSSLHYYSTQTDQMNVIYDKILERLYELESEVAAKHSDH